jgi:hypothetical protein
VKLARRIFRGSLLYTAALTAFWLMAASTGAGGGVFFQNSRVDVETLVRLAMGFLVFWVGYNWLFYRLKRLLLRRLVGLTQEEIEAVFATRSERFSLVALLARYSERRIRIVDMIGRRARTLPAVLLAFFLLAAQIAKNPGPESLAFGIRDNFLDAIALCWWSLLTYGSDGILGRIVYGAQARIMDGVLARSNALLIGTLWQAFKFVMIPIGLQLGRHFPADTYAALFVFIWISYLISDALSEIVGSLWGRQRLRVWGVGDVNRKSVAGTAACFLSSLVVCLATVAHQGLPASWIALAFVISLSNTAVELFSPRGTDDFTMATSNALWCWAFGALLY